MNCPFHEMRKPRFFNGSCWYCRKAELRYLADIEIENGYLRNRPSGLSNKTITTVCRLRRVARIRRVGIRKPSVAVTSQNMEGVMSFREIGEILGISKSGAEQLYKSGLRKLREMHPQHCEKLLELSNLRQSCLGEPAMKQA